MSSTVKLVAVKGKTSAHLGPYAAHAAPFVGVTGIDLPDGLPAENETARTSDSPGDNETPLSFREVGKNAGQGRRVGWTLHTQSGGLVAGMGFKINPQALTRAPTQRNQLFATQSRFYVDDFGPGPTTITMRQLIGSGKEIRNAATGIVTQQFTARGDVQRFMESIYGPAAGSPGKYVIRFHDNHYAPELGGAGERIFFPANAIDIQRSVDLHNVWMVSITMLSLEPHPDVLDQKPERSGRQKRPVVSYKCPRDETLIALAHRLGGKKASQARLAGLLQAFVALNNGTGGTANLRKARTVVVRRNGADARLKVSGYKVLAGEVIRVPGK